MGSQNAHWGNVQMPHANAAMTCGSMTTLIPQPITWKILETMVEPASHSALVKVKFAMSKLAAAVETVE